MVTHFLDTNVIVAITKGNRTVISKLEGFSRGEIAISTVVYAELLYGAEKSRAPAKNRAASELAITGTPRVVVDDTVAEHYAAIRAGLEREGTPIGPHDLIIAATARAFDAAIVTNNTREFDRVPGLAVEDWTV